MIKMLTSMTRIVLLTLVLTLCGLSVFQIPIPQEFYETLKIVVIFFFGARAGELSSKSVDKPIDTFN